MTDADQKAADRLSAIYAAKFRGIKRPDGLEGDPTLCDLEIAFAKGYAVACKAKQLKVDQARWNWLDERARSAKVIGALKLAVDYLKEVSFWMDPKAQSWIKAPDIWSAQQTAAEALKAIAEYEASK